tara:strand:+ start:828 stop:1610 length:783 start_codon:yes stop_codon:yes gene_type:complete
LKLKCGSECLQEGDQRNPALVFLHGVGTEASYWQVQLKKFSSGFRTIAWNAPGYGDSNPISRFTFKALVKRLERALDELKVSKAFFVGHSFGGMILQELAVLHPERIAGMVLYSTSPAFGKADGTWQKEFLRKRLAPMQKGKTLKEIAPIILRELTGDSPDQAGILLGLESTHKIPNKVYEQALRCIVTFDQRSNLEKLKGPVLVLSGEKDLNAPPAMMQKMASRIPNANYVCLQGIGHLANLECPRVFNQTLNDFFISL